MQVPGPQLAQRLTHLQALPLAHQARVHVKQMHLLGRQHRQQKGCDHRGVHPTGSQQQHGAPAHLGAQGRGDFAQIGLDAPLPPGAADAHGEIFENALAVLAVGDLRVELQPVHLPAVVPQNCGQAVFGHADRAEAFGQAQDGVAVAHPGNEAVRHALQKVAWLRQPHRGPPVLLALQ